MLIGFLGAPCSGKTTTAARLFAELKDTGTPAEFLPEYAREHIAWNRSSGVNAPLTDYDQHEILARQYMNELTWKRAVGGLGVVVTDSSPINTLLYISEEKRKEHWLKIIPEMLECKHYSLLFYCTPVEPKVSLDPNRIHTLEESRELDKKLQLIIEANPELPVIELYGDSNQRFRQALNAALDKLVVG